MNSQPTIKVHAPSRVHFGLLGGEDASGPSFGGLGVMVNDPGIELTLEPAEQFSVTGAQADRVNDFVNSWCASAQVDPPAAIQMSLVRAPSSHIGLGTGTQLGMAVSAALFQTYFGEVPSVERIAQFVGRGRRSGVGLYGFLHGGFIVDRGRELDESMPQLDMHIPFPNQWRIVLIRSRSTIEVFGEKEKKVFDRDNKIDLIGKRNQLIGLAKEQIVPAILAEDFEKFSQSIFDFGKTSGSYFSAIQGGPFNGSRITEIIEVARNLGISGVGQTSWGPTVYALANSTDHANQIVESMSVHLYEDETITVSEPNNSGATVSVFENTTSNS